MTPLRSTSAKRSPPDVARKIRLTRRIVEAAPAADEEYRIWDSEISGFCVRVHPTGRKVFTLKYRHAGAQRTLTIGTFGPDCSTDDARREADEARPRVRRGEDPALEKQEARAALKVTQLIDAYLRDGPATKPNKRESSWGTDRSYLTRHIRLLLGTRVANSVTKADAAKALRAIQDGKTARRVKTGRRRGLARVTGGAGASRRTKSATGAMFAWGIEHKLVSNNPFAGIKLGAEPKRERFLSEEEARRLLGVLDAAMPETSGDVIRLLLFTGARKTEISALRWAEVDWERAVLRLPPQRTKAGGSTGERRITLSPPAMEILMRRRNARDARDAKDAFVLPATAGRSGAHVVGLRRHFLKACAAAGLENVRIHDLRHSFASFAIADGQNLFLVGKLLGRASTRTTERYAHLSADPLQAAAARVGQRLLGPRG